MALLGPAAVQRPMQQNQTGDANALNIAHYTGVVRGTIERKSVLEPLISPRSVTGTNTITNYAVGESTLQKLIPGEAPEGTKSDASKKSLTVDTVVLARQMTPLIDEFQSAYDYRQAIGAEHGKKIAKFKDQAFFIQAAKTALLTQSAYSGGVNGKPAGHSGGSTVTFANGSEALDPAMLYAKICDLLTKMQEKDVDPGTDGVMLAMQPKYFNALRQAEQIINGEYITSDGRTINNMTMFKEFSTPVVSSMNVPSTAITGHMLSNAANSNAYDGDFTKLVAVAFSPESLLAGETIPLTTSVHYDETWKHWFIDAWLSFGVTADRAEYSGALLLP